MLMIVGFGLLIVADPFWALSGGLTRIAVGVLPEGAHLGFTRGLLPALLAETVLAELRGTAFGVFNLVTGVALLLASVFAAVAAIWILPLRGKIENGKRPPAAQVET